MGLREKKFELEYRSLKKDVVKEFYEPALMEANSYRRAVGFFSSTSLIEVSYGLQKLVENGGTIQLVASPKLSEEDMEAIEKGYETRNKILEEVMLRDFTDPINSFQEKRLNLLANYIAEGKLDFKLAFIHNKRQEAYGIFHEKLGLISDGLDTLAFSGSMNETRTGMYGNYETIDVFCDWKSEESYARVQKKKQAFERIWNNTEDNIEVMEFPKAVRDKIEQFNIGTIQERIDQEDFLQQEQAEEARISKPAEGVRLPDWFEPREYQEQAASVWTQNGYRGIYDMATGTGKTYTALLSIVELYREKRGNLAVIVCCPYQHLVEQWVDDMRQFGMDPIIGYSGSGYKNYREKLNKAVFDFNLGVKEHFSFICTNATFCNDKVQEIIRKLQGNTLLVVDEAHNFGAENTSQTMSEVFQFRLALSATLNRHRDEAGTQRLKQYFGSKCIEYTLEQAIDDKMLTPYYYYPVKVYLTEDELQSYIELSIEIAKCMRIGKNGKRTLSEQGERLALQRARLVAGAVGKCDKLVEIMQDYKEDNSMLVYCGATKIIKESWYYDVEPEESRQIDYITQLLGNELGMRVAQFTSRENKEERRKRIIHFQDHDLQALIAIKCLDEGVNIPGIRTAFILASSTNPKEYIQRRGRVLRLAKGKDYAKIYDFVTLPRTLEEAALISDEEIARERALVKNELSRIREFKRMSLNPLDSDELITEMIDSYRIYKEEEENEAGDD